MTSSTLYKPGNVVMVRIRFTDDGIMTKQRKDTSVSLQPLTFDEAIRELVKTPKRKDSEVGESGNSKEAVPESATSKKRNALRPKSSSH